MKDKELGVLVQEEGDVYPLSHMVCGDDKLYDLIEKYLNKLACTLVVIHNGEDNG